MAMKYATAYPDAQYQIDDLFATQDKVVSDGVLESMSIALTRREKLPSLGQCGID